MVTSLTPFPYTISTLTNISPVTYRDASTFLDQLEDLKHWLSTVNIPEVETILTGILEQAQDGVTNAELTVLDAKAGWQTLFDEFMADVSASIGVINNAVIDGRITAGIAGKLDTATAATTYETKADATTKLADAIAALKNDPLAAWKAAVQAQKTAPAIYVNLGDSIANGGNATTWARNWLWRFTALYTNRLPSRLDAGTLDPAPDSGVAVYTGAVGGLNSANYITDTYVARIGNLKPKLISHIVGTNDFAQNMNPATYRANIKTWVDKIRLVSPSSIHLFIHVPERVDGFTGSFMWSQYKDQLVSLADEYKGFSSFLDIDAEFRKHGPTGTTDRYKFWDADNLHFHNDGNKALSDVIARHVGAPRNDYLPREIERGLTVPPGSVTTNITVSSFVVKAKPYLREGVAMCNVYCGATAGTGDLVLAYGPTGQADTDYNSHRLSGTQSNHSTQTFLSLEPNTEYTIKLVTDTYGGGTIAFGGTSKYFSFIADISPA